MGFRQEGSSISRQNLNENLETLQLAPTLFYHLPGFYFKTEFLNPHPLSLGFRYVSFRFKKEPDLELLTTYLVISPHQIRC